jgi:hypothetical protein
MSTSVGVGRSTIRRASATSSLLLFLSVSLACTRAGNCIRPGPRPQPVRQIFLASLSTAEFGSMRELEEIEIPP